MNNHCDYLSLIFGIACREKVMKTDQDWKSVWPGARTFHPASVPLPVRQGFAQLKGQVTPGKYANVELMKVPNFLHLTPPTIKAHCNSIQKFCTEWPKGESFFTIVISTNAI